MGDTLYFVVINVIMVSICALVQLGRNSKIVGHTAKRIENLDRVTRVPHIWGIFDLVLSNIILGSFTALLPKLVSYMIQFHRTFV